MPGILSLIAGALWVLAIIQIMFPLPDLSSVMAGLLVCFVIGAITRVAWHTQILCTALALVTVALAWFYGQWSAVVPGITKAAIFPAFLSTIVLLRATAEQRPEIVNARQMFGELDPLKRDSGIVIGTHLIGAILQVGVFAILAPILGRDAPVKERREVFTVAIRGMATVPFWSPFVVGMAVASQYLPLVPLWQIMALGMVLSILGIVTSILVFDRNPGLGTLRRALRSLVPIAFPIFVSALVVVGTVAVTGLSTLQALILSLPIPCLLAALQVRAASVPEVCRQTTGGIGRIGPETSILTCSTTLGAVFEAALPHMGLLAWFNTIALSAVVVIFIVILTMNIAGLFGVHAIVTGTFLLVIFTSVPTGLSDLVLMQSLLVGWGLCSVISIGSLSIATGAAMFRIPPTDLITRANIAYVFLTSVIAGAILTGLNALII
ncbi:MAG: hypothetical protein VYA17_04350 [Pseudomonadota bacterium]|nr:hypothetical protein [Pseudomonadota bacterium]